MAPPKRPFNPEALSRFAVAGLRPQIGVDTVAVWRYTVFVPVEESRSDGQMLPVATADDLQILEGMLADHFGRCIGDLELLALACDPTDFVNRVEYLPLR